MQQLREELKKDLRITTLDDVADIIMGQSPPSASYNKDGDGLPFLQGKADFSNSKKYPIIRQWTSAPTKISESGSILFTVRAPVGELFYNNVKACIGRGLASISAKSNNSQEFLYQFLQSKKAEFNKLSQGSTFTAINSDALRKIKIAVPSLKEQKKIAEVLSKVDEDIERVSEIIKQAIKLKKGLMQELFTKGIGHKRFKKTKAGVMPEEWEIKKVEDICEVLDNKRIPIEKGKRKKGNIPYYGATGVVDYVNGYIFDEELLLVGEDGADWSSFANTAYIVRGKSWVNNHAHVLRCKGVDIEFLRNFLNYSDLQNYITGTTRGKLNKGFLMSIEIPYPSKKEQDKISNILVKVDEKIDINRSIKSKLEILKKGLMQDLLSA